MKLVSTLGVVAAVALGGVSSLTNAAAPENEPHLTAAAQPLGGTIEPARDPGFGRYTIGTVGAPSFRLAVTPLIVGHFTTPAVVQAVFLTRRLDPASNDLALECRAIVVEADASDGRLVWSDLVRVSESDPMLCGSPQLLPRQTRTSTDRLGLLLPLPGSNHSLRAELDLAESRLSRPTLVEEVPPGLPVAVAVVNKSNALSRAIPGAGSEVGHRATELLRQVRQDLAGLDVRAEVNDLGQSVFRTDSAGTAQALRLYLNQMAVPYHSEVSASIEVGADANVSRTIVASP